MTPDAEDVPCVIHLKPTNGKNRDQKVKFHHNKVVWIMNIN